MDSCETITVWSELEEQSPDSLYPVFAVNASHTGEYSIEFEPGVEIDSALYIEVDNAIKELELQFQFVLLPKVLSEVRDILYYEVREGRLFRSVENINKWISK